MDRIQKGQFKVPGNRYLKPPSMMWEGIQGFIPTSDEALIRLGQPIFLDCISENLLFGYDD